MITNKGQSSSNNSLLWQISLDDQFAVVAGTMHIAFKGYEQIVSRFTSAMDQHQTTHYFGETDMNDMSEHAGALTGNFKRLSDQMSRHRFQNYRKKLIQFTSLDLRLYDLLPPMLLSSLIASKLINYNSTSIDEILWRHAELQGCAVNGLESFEEQLQIFHRIPYDYQVKQLKNILGNLTKCRVSLRKLTTLYQEELIHQLYVQGKSTLGPIKQMMLKERNEIMVDRIISKMLNVNGNCFFSFGAAHLAGKYGILHGLKLRGCVARPLSA